jgi:N-acetylneuraminic acid mutarotase
MYIIGGRNDQGIISNKTYRYNIKTNVWDAKQNVPTPILGAASARIGDNIFIIGGMVTTPGTVTRKVYKYNIENDLWNNAADFPRSFTDGDAVPYQDSLIYVVGSYNSEKTFVYNINKNKWRECNPVPSPGTSLSYGAVSISGNKLVYVGGSNGTFSTTYWNNVWIGEIDQNNRSVINWTQGTSFPGQTRTFFELQPWNNGLILIGGTTDNTFDTYTNENYFFDVENNTWSQLTNKPTAWNTGNAASVFLNGNWKLICSGGFEQQYLKKTEIYNQENLSVSDNSETCQLKNMKTISGNRPGINFCLSENGETYLTIWDMQGRKIKKKKNRG